MYVSVHPERCTGCRVCELECSFHVTGEYKPRDSRIQVMRDMKRKLFIPVISPFGGLVHDTSGRVVVCDLCGKCVEACPTDALEAYEGDVVSIEDFGAAEATMKEMEGGAEK